MEKWLWFVKRMPMDIYSLAMMWHVVSSYFLDRGNHSPYLASSHAFGGIQTLLGWSSTLTPMVLFTWYFIFTLYHIVSLGLGRSFITILDSVLASLHHLLG